MNKAQHTTINIGHLVGSGKLKMSIINKIYSGLIVWNFEIPNAPYSHRYVQLSSLWRDKALFIYG